ncbi:MAG TPA: nucleotide pyrophosphohydrolase [Pelomicrobium sp.]|nr:nucleotide pyrophosphohydrolase [Pelomicrobium sp.]
MRYSSADRPFIAAAFPPVTSRPTADSLQELRARLRAFAAERDWDQFHNPKNLAMALAGEAGELLEHFQWLTLEQSANLPPDVLAEVELEIADVLLFLVRLADKLGIDPAAAAEKKLALNARKYPVDKSRGKATKYNKL